LLLLLLLLLEGVSDMLLVEGVQLLLLATVVGRSNWPLLVLEVVEVVAGRH
jgi:hypothetical protein